MLSWSVMTYIRELDTRRIVMTELAKTKKHLL